MWKKELAFIANSFQGTGRTQRNSQIIRSIACCRRTRPYEITIERDGDVGAVEVDIEWAQILAWTMDGRLLAAARRSVFLEEDGVMVPVKVPECVAMAQSFVVDLSRQNELVGLVGCGACVFEGGTTVWTQEGNFTGATLSASRETIFLAHDEDILRCSMNANTGDNLTARIDGTPEALTLVFPDIFVAVSSTAEKASRVVCFSWDLECLRELVLPYVTPTWNGPLCDAECDVVLQLCGRQGQLFVSSSRGVRFAHLDGDATFYIIHIWDNAIARCDVLPSGDCVSSERAATGMQRMCLFKEDAVSTEDESLSYSEKDEQDDSTDLQAGAITVMTRHIPPGSALGRAMRPISAGPKTTTKPASKSSKIPNLPTTFHRKVKSSGYLPKAKTQPRIKSKARTGIPLDNTRSQLSTTKTKAPTYCSSPPLHHETTVALSAAATDVLYTPSGSHLLVATSDYTLWSYRLPATKNAPLGLQHKAPVTSVCASVTDMHSTGGGGGPLCLTTSNSVCHLWALCGARAGQQLVTFDKLLSSRRESGDSAPMEAVDAIFMCLDTVVLIAMPTQLGVYRYQLHTQDLSDDIKRLQKFGAYKCTGLLTHDGAPLTNICANNNMTSGLAIANSQRDIAVWDLAAEKQIAQAENAARLTSVRLSLPLGSGSPHECDLFYTASIDGCVRIWDLRTMQVACTFTGGHKHSCQRLTPKWSPCMSHMAVPSETGEVCIYDARSAAIVGSVRAHRDVASGVDFHPLSGTLVSAGFDSALHFYRAVAPVSKTHKPSGGARERHWTRPNGNLREPPQVHPRELDTNSRERTFCWEPMHRDVPETCAERDV